MDFHGQDATFKFIVDCFDLVFYLFFVIELGALILLQRIHLRRVEFWTKIEIILAFVCTLGVIYEAVTANSIREFFSSEDLASDIFRSFKYLRIMIVIINSPYFLEAKLILQSTFRSLYNIKNVVGLWLVIVI